MCRRSSGDNNFLGGACYARCTHVSSHDNNNLTICIKNKKTISKYDNNYISYYLKTTPLIRWSPEALGLFIPICTMYLNYILFVLVKSYLNIHIGNIGNIVGTYLMICSMLYMYI